MDDIAWKERIKARANQIGWRVPMTREVYRAIDAVSHASRRRHQPSAPPLTTHDALTTEPDPLPDLRRTTSTGFVQVGTMSPTTSGNVCGNSKTVSGASPLVCNREAGHAGDHGMASHGVVIVRWSR
jgi:hypothetical protein